MQIRRTINHSDILGAFASGLCLIHCAITPVLFSIRPIIEGAALDFNHRGCCWAAMDYIFLLISLGAVWYSARYTSNNNIKRVLWIAWSAFTVGLLSEQWEISYSKWLMYAGSLGLIITHFHNYRYCQNCK